MRINHQEKRQFASMVLAFLLGLSCVVLPIKAIEQPVASAQGIVRFG